MPEQVVVVDPDCKANHVGIWKHGTEPGEHPEAPRHGPRTVDPPQGDADKDV
jgi:hypothetical protein